MNVHQTVLHAFKVYDSCVANEPIFEELAKCQDACHEWGALHQVEFESSKESFTILDRHKGSGDEFKLESGIFSLNAVS